MLTQLITFPRDQHFYLACSGGVDSMTVCDFYRRGNRNFTLAHYNHATPQADAFESFVRNFATKNNIPFISAKLTVEKPKDKSREEWWRDNRYAWFLSMKDPVVVCQHLSDVMEGFVFSCLHGNPKIMPVKRDNIVRPFLTTSKEEFYAWASRHNVDWIEDVSNNDVSVPRNRIRHRVLPECLAINPGLAKVVKKKVIAAFKESQS